MRHYWAMPYGERFIWGATAGMLVTFHRLVTPATLPTSLAGVLAGSPQGS